ncbi:MAG TPA: hypothetical protein VK891_15510 [Euzebyales bacterium]|nr:hypothetical protein [Euzebyales bacterium]
MTVTEALAAPTGSTVTVRGYVIATAGVTLLCEMLAETFPPQPGGAQMLLDDLDIAAVADTQSAGDTTWTSDQRAVTGIIAGDVLRVLEH